MNNSINNGYFKVICTINNSQCEYTCKVGSDVEIFIIKVNQAKEFFET